MKIAFCGASGTGKTTLTDWVQEIYRLDFNPVGSRSVAKAMGFDSPYDVDKAGKRAEFQQRLLDDKVGWEAGRESFVTDRTPLDNLLYTSLHDVYSITEAQIDKALEHTRSYDLVFYTPLSAFINTAGDKDRAADQSYHRVYDMAMCGFLERTFGTTTAFLGGLRQLHLTGLEERKEYISDAISAFTERES